MKNERRLIFEFAVTENEDGKSITYRGLKNEFVEFYIWNRKKISK
jgi:hypothetical protein